MGLGLCFLGMPAAGVAEHGQQPVEIMDGCKMAFFAAGVKNSAEAFTHCPQVWACSAVSLFNIGPTFMQSYFSIGRHKQGKKRKLKREKKP